MQLLEDVSSLSKEDGTDHVPQGFYKVDDGDSYTQFAGQILVNLKDLLNTKYHPDPRRLNGCCGLDGTDGRNLMCLNGHEISPEMSDCWLAHVAALAPAMILQSRPNVNIDE